MVSNEFQSAFLEDELKVKVDSLSKKSTVEEFKATKDAVAKCIHDSPKFKKERKISELRKLQSISKPIDLQFYFYSYIQAAEGNKILK